MVTDVKSDSLIDRRCFVRAAGFGFASILAPRPAAALERTDAVYASAFRRADGAYGVAIFTEAGQLVYSCPLPVRGHDVVQSPSGDLCIVFARRPGTCAVVLRPDGSEPPNTFTTPPGRHFYGHGVFSNDGRVLYAAENDFDNARGVIGIYDVGDRFNRLGEYYSHGVGPHEVLLMPDGSTLAIANGGIETHPDFGRTKLNIATMAPNLAFVEAATGGLVEKHEVPGDLSRLSLRHMAVEKSGRVWFGCQYQGDSREKVPLAGSVCPGEPVSWLDVPQMKRMANYVGSVTLGKEDGLLGLTSPEGGVHLQIATRDPSRVRILEMPGVCGVASASGGFFVTTMDNGDPVGGDIRNWDNHLTRL
jgi:uncharacterized protein